MKKKTWEGVISFINLILNNSNKNLFSETFINF
jgi:hypothetical protein